MKKVEKRIYVIAAVFILLVGISSLGASYGLWSKTYTQSGNNTITPGCLDISLTEGDAVNLTKSYPITDTAGKGTKGYSLTVKNTCTIMAPISLVLNIETSSTMPLTDMKAYVDGSKTLNPTLINNLPQTTVLKSTSDTISYSGARVLLNDILAPATTKGGNDGGTKTYNIKLWIKEDSTISQTSSKTFKGKIAINSELSNNLLTKILYNNPVQVAQTSYFLHYSPECASGSINNQQCSGNWMTTEYGKGLFATKDDDGTSYYFRGAVENNNVTFAGIKWKILRINGDGTIRLIATTTSELFDNVLLFSSDWYTYNNSHACTNANPCESDFNGSVFTDNYKNSSTSDSYVKEALENWYKTKLASYNDKIALTKFCNDTSIVNSSGLHASANNMNQHNPVLTCNDPTDYNSASTHNYGGVYRLKVGLPTVNELYLAGGHNSYDSLCVGTNNYLSELMYNIVTFSPYNSSNFYTFDASLTYIQYMSLTSGERLIPVINLNSDVNASGSGTESDPYIVQ